MPKFRLGQEVVVKGKIKEVREGERGTLYEIEIEGNRLFSPVVPETEVVEDGK
jgi:hypothetical protein